MYICNDFMWLYENNTNICLYAGPLQPGDVARTGPGNLGYECVYHAVGPRWCDYDTSTEEGVKTCLEVLENTLINCFKKASADGMKTIAVPSISSGMIRKFYFFNLFVRTRIHNGRILNSTIRRNFVIEEFF